MHFFNFFKYFWPPYWLTSRDRFKSIRKQSTETELIVTIDDLTKSIDMTILDFAKAFDKVPHRRLLYKLNYYGIRRKLLNWFEHLFYTCLFFFESSTCYCHRDKVGIGSNRFFIGDDSHTKITKPDILSVIL